MHEYRVRSGLARVRTARVTAGADGGRTGADGRAAPSFNAAQIAGIKRVDDNYTIRNPVKSDGILRIYVLATPYGDITVQGDEMLRMRINELKALAALEKVSNSESFGKALAEAG